MDGKKTKRCEQGGKICIFNLGDCPFERYLSASHYSSTTWHFSLSPEAPHIKKTSVAFGTFAFTADLWGLSAQGGKLPFIIQTLQKKKKLTDKLEFCRQAFPLVDTAPGDGWHKAAVWGDTACCPRAGAPEWSVAAGGASISGSQRDAAQRRAAPLGRPSLVWKMTPVCGGAPEASRKQTVVLQFPPPFFPTGETGVSPAAPEPLARKNCDALR